jgi:ATP-binding cassette subfamily G (WHITE) protein 1
MAKVAEVRVEMTDMLPKSSPKPPPSSPESKAWCIRFRSLRYSVPLPDGTELDILRGISGGVRNGEMVALMGASGAGKTTLLNVLSGRAAAGSLKDGSQVRLRGAPVSTQQFRSISGYVTQTDTMPNSLTPLEILEFTAGVRLSNREVSAPERRKRALQIFERLGIAHCAHKIVGEPGIDSGISGGERKRVNIANSLVINPELLFLDEPTSGLDASTALSVMNTLQQLVKRDGKACLCTIHQPSAEIFALFDKVLLMAEGRAAYFGDVQGAATHFASASVGMPCPGGKNLADHLIECVTVPRDHEANAEERAAARERVQRILQAGAVLENEIAHRDTFPDGDQEVKSDASGEFGYANGEWVQFKHLFRRAWRMQTRSRMLTKARLAQTIGPSVLMGILYFQIGDGQTTIQDRQGALFMATVMQCMLATIGVLFTFPIERNVFAREQADGAYSTKTYFAAKSTVDLPFQCFFSSLFAVIFFHLIGFAGGLEGFCVFWGAVVLMANVGAGIGFMISGATGDVSVSLSVAPGIFMPMMLFSGFLVNLENVTWALW